MPHATHALLVVLALFAAVPAQSAEPSMAGHYYLEGVMETGSELLLDPKGTFQWYLAYGALDLFAQGEWKQADGAVILTSRKAKDMPDPPFETLRLTIHEKDLVPPDERGAYMRGSD